MTLDGIIGHMLKTKNTSKVLFHWDALNTMDTNFQIYQRCIRSLHSCPVYMWSWFFWHVSTGTDMTLSIETSTSGAVSLHAAADTTTFLCTQAILCTQPVIIKPILHGFLLKLSMLMQKDQQWSADIINKMVKNIHTDICWNRLKRRADVVVHIQIRRLGSLHPSQWMVLRLKTFHTRHAMWDLPCLVIFTMLKLAHIRSSWFSANSRGIFIAVPLWMVIHIQQVMRYYTTMYYR